MDGPARSLDEAGPQGEPGEVGAPPALGLVADAVEVGADGAQADVELLGYLGVGTALGDQGDQFLFTAAELRQAWRYLRSLRVWGGEHTGELGGGGQRHRRAAFFGCP